MRLLFSALALCAAVLGHAAEESHLDQAREQLARAPRPFPSMRINPAVQDIFGFKYEDFSLEGYDPHPAIKAPIAV